MSDTDYIAAAQRNSDYNDGSKSMIDYLIDREVVLLDSHMVADSVACELAAALRELCPGIPEGVAGIHFPKADAALARFDATIGNKGDGNE